MTRSRARTPSGATAGTPSRTTGRTGPANNQLGGTQIGDTGLWVGDYTIQPENGGLSVFAHEYGHDLGLPDHYDTAAAATTPSSWWTLMAQSRLGAKDDAGIGDRARRPRRVGQAPARLARLRDRCAGAEADARPRPAGVQLDQAAGARRRCCRRRRSPPSWRRRPPGPNQWWSGSGRRPEQHADPQVTLPAGTADAEVPGPLGHRGLRRRRRATTPTSRSTTAPAARPIPGSHHQGRPRATASTAPATAGSPATFDLSAYAGKTVELRFRYITDGAAEGNDRRDRRASSSTTSRSPPAARRVHRRRRDRPNGWTARRLHRRRRADHDGVRQLLHRLEPHLRLVRQVPEDRPVQLRLGRTPGRTGSSTSRTSRVC